MHRYNILAVGAAACLSAAITWYLVDPHAFVLHKLHLQPRLLSTSRDTVSTSNFAFYKLSLQWPPSTCTSEPPAGLNCRGPVPGQFTIHGLWPQDAKDKRIPPYNPANPCTTDIPISPDNLIPYLQQIDEKLKRLWPNLRNSGSEQQNQFFWREEWRKHGMCSDYPDEPFDYFNSALNLRDGFDPAFQLTPGKSYTVKQVADAVRRQVGAKPEIACSRSKEVKKRLQLWEIRLCYNKEMPPKTLKDCPKDFSGPCGSLQDSITFPDPPSSSDEMADHSAGIGSEFQASDEK
ncbi:ribonuclease 1-like [Herrania umbratica]|uniref:Ribonuclease 1-like n=1 Tax=Herrania umbratica TaxID=108875 RepID=A0A6J0ZWR9_9ROSI|nr:ribonuclease 1-like [Herrania umbratica]